MLDIESSIELARHAQDVTDEAIGVQQRETDARAELARLIRDLNGELTSVAKNAEKVNDTINDVLTSLSEEESARQVRAIRTHLLSKVRALSRDAADMRQGIDGSRGKVGALAELVSEQADRDTPGFEQSLDPVSGAADKRAFEAFVLDALRRARATSSPLSLVLFEVDFFTHLAETHGQRMGDEVLAQLGETLNTGVRTGDLVARVSMERFAVVLPGAPFVVAQAVAERLRTEVGAVRFRKMFGTFTVTLSSGVTVASGTEDAKALYERTQRALHSAIEAGRDRTVGVPPE